MTALRKTEAAPPPIGRVDSYEVEPYGADGSTERFDPKLEAFFASALKPNEFCARLTGDGFMPTGGVATQLHDGQHLVRGALTP